MELVIIAFAAAATAVLSALAGLGGGIILLAVLAQFFAPVVAIPIQSSTESLNAAVAVSVTLYEIAKLRAG